jgi:hypothetical protein
VTSKQSVSSHRVIPGVVPGATVVLYLEVAGGKLRLKAGDWDSETDARTAATPYLAGSGFVSSNARMPAG